MILRRVTVLVIVVTLSASSAWAECAWVMWTKVKPNTAEPLESSWTPEEAALSQAECKKRQDAAIASLMSAQGGGYGKRKLFGTTVIVS